jgi:putative SOS response-associated peptidase YedK
MAGVYQSGVGCAVVTQSASETLTEIHHRQPVVLGAHDLNFWLDGAESSDELPALEICYHPVSTRVGSTRYDDSSLIAPIDLDGATVGQTADLFSGDKRFSAEDGKR